MQESVGGRSIGLCDAVNLHSEVGVGAVGVQGVKEMTESITKQPDDEEEGLEMRMPHLINFDLHGDADIAPHIAR
jgi:hypothetical protein